MTRVGWVGRGEWSSLDGGDFAFVRVAEAPVTLDRRPNRVARERAEGVVVSEGLDPGAVVSARGSLMLEGLFEDRTLDAGPTAAR